MKHPSVSSKFVHSRPFASVCLHRAFSPASPSLLPLLSPCPGHLSFQTHVERYPAGVDTATLRARAAHLRALLASWAAGVDELRARHAALTYFSAAQLVALCTDLGAAATAGGKANIPSRCLEVRTPPPLGSSAGLLDACRAKALRSYSVFRKCTRVACVFSNPIFPFACTPTFACPHIRHTAQAAETRRLGCESGLASNRPIWETTAVPLFRSC